ncbi:hypothetical protein ZWY2020_007629 [Hordeum vulgare]|nr:hypothetical protein ZWY2020_007629 [Hordeum vulgare]
MTMALSLLRARLSVGRSCATGLAKAVRGSTNTSNAAVTNLGNVRRFSAGAGIGNNNSSEKITKATSKGPRVLPACLLAATVGLGAGYVIKRHVDETDRALDHASSTLLDETKAELLRYVDGKFSEAQELTKSFQIEARANLLRDRGHAENAISAFEAESRGELARIRKQIADWRAADERTLTQFKTEVTETVNSRAANRGVSAECSMEFARIRQEIRGTDRRLSSVQSQLSTRAANEGKFAECSSEIARLRQEVGNTDRKLSSVLQSQCLIKMP